MACIAIGDCGSYLVRRFAMACDVMRSNIASIACLLAAAINLSCALLCCSWRKAIIIVVVSPSSSAAASSWAARAASLNRECFTVACQYCLCSSHFFHEVILEFLAGLLRSGLVLPCNHLVLSEHLPLPHSCASRHCHFLDACHNAAVGKGGSKLIEAGEIGRDVCCHVPLLPVPLSLVLKLLGDGHLDCHLLTKVLHH
jgi:hypothetical protein